AVLVNRVNEELPSDINILSASVVPHRFHARHDALARQYVYQISRRRTAFVKPYVWWVKDPIDVGHMRKAATAFVGMRNFRSFAAPDVAADQTGTPRSMMVLVERADIIEEGDLVLIVIEG